MSATVRELVDEAYDRRRSTWRAALETVNDWIESTCAASPRLSGDRVVVTRGRIKDPLAAGEKLRRKLADSNDEIHESVEVENQVIDVVGARVICQTEREQNALFDDLQSRISDSALSIAEVRDYCAHPKPSGYRGRHLIVEVPFDSEPSVLVEVQIRTILQDAWCTLAEVHLFKPGQALKADTNQDRLALVLSNMLAQADAVAGFITDDLDTHIRGDDRRRKRSSAEAAVGSSDSAGPDAGSAAVPPIEVTVRALKHSYVLAADEVGRHGIIRFENLGLTPDNADRAKLPAPGDKLHVRIDETPTTRYFIPVVTK